MLLTLGMLRMSPRSPAFSAARNCCFGLNLRFFRASDASHTYKCIVVLFLFISFLISAVEQVEGLGLKIFCGRTFYFCNKQRQQRCAFPLAAFKPSAAGWSRQCSVRCFASFCIGFQQAGLWGKKFLYLTAPVCPIPEAIAIHCAKLKPIGCALCFLEVEVSRYSAQLIAIWNWKCVIWVPNTFGLPLNLIVLSVAECSKWRNQERVLHIQIHDYFWSNLWGNLQTLDKSSLIKESGFILSDWLCQDFSQW